MWSYKFIQQWFTLGKYCKDGLLEKVLAVMSKEHVVSSTMYWLLISFASIFASQMSWPRWGTKMWTSNKAPLVVIVVAVLSMGSLLNASLACAQSYTEWKMAHPNAEAELAVLKTKTAAMRRASVKRSANQTAVTKPYADLVQRSRALKADARSQVAELLKSSIELSNAGDYASATTGLKRVLELDPVNAEANYYYGDVLQKQRNRSGAAEYMTRAKIFGGTSTIALKAETALQNLPAPPPATDTRASEPTKVWNVPGTINDLIDCAECPAMTIIPAGEFTMGSPPSETGRNEAEWQHRVTIGYPLAVSTLPITRGDYAKFVADTQHAGHPNGCFISENGRFIERKDNNWDNPGFFQTDRNPVVCVSAEEGKAYAAWLSNKTGKKYRLLSEAEYEYAARAGTTTAYWWGDQIGVGKTKCRGCDGESAATVASQPMSDLGPGVPPGMPPSGEAVGRGGAIPGGSLPLRGGGPGGATGTTLSGLSTPNPFGLYDMNGNAASWVEDCYHDDYTKTPTDGSPWTDGGKTCAQHAMRGGSWFNGPEQSRAAAHFRIMSPNPAHNHLGFRIAREL